MKETLGSLPRFLRFLATMPDAQSLVLALASGPLAPYAPMGVVLWRLEEDALVCLAQTGLTSDEASRYTVIPAVLDSVIWRAVRTDSVIVTPVDAHDPESGRGSFAEFDQEHWSRMVGRLHGQCVLRAPVRYAGRAIGGVGAITGVEWDQSPESVELLRCVGDSIALWMSSMAGELDAVVAANRSRARRLSMEFSERQLDILRFVEGDEPNSLIARRLQVSESSVKQDLQHVMRVLNTRSRATAAQKARNLGLL